MDESPCSSATSGILKQILGDDDDDEDSSSSQSHIRRSYQSLIKEFQRIKRGRSVEEEKEYASEEGEEDGDVEEDYEKVDNDRPHRRNFNHENEHWNNRFKENLLSPGPSGNLFPAIIDDPKSYARPNFRYLSESTVEVFHGDRRGTIELLRLKNGIDVDMDLKSRLLFTCTDEETQAQLTTAAFLENQYFTMYGTFDGWIKMIRYDIDEEQMFYDKKNIYRIKEEFPVMGLSFNHIDASLVCASYINLNKNCDELFVLDLVRQRNILDPAVLSTFQAGTKEEEIMDMQWSWYHTSYLLVATNKGIRILDLRDYSHGSQALFTSYKNLILAPSKWRAELFAVNTDHGNQGHKIKLFDVRKMCVDLWSQEINENVDVLQWHPTKPYDLLYSSRTSCFIGKLNTETCTAFTYMSQESIVRAPERYFILSGERVWDINQQDHWYQQELVKQREAMYNVNTEPFPLLGYYDQIKMAAEQDWVMPLILNELQFNNNEEIIEHEQLEIGSDYNTSTSDSLESHRTSSKAMKIKLIREVVKEGEEDDGEDVEKELNRLLRPSTLIEELNTEENPENKDIITSIEMEIGETRDTFALEKREDDDQKTKEEDKEIQEMIRRQKINSPTARLNRRKSQLAQVFGESDDMDTIKGNLKQYFMGKNTSNFETVESIEFPPIGIVKDILKAHYGSEVNEAEEASLLLGKRKKTSVAVGNTRNMENSKSSDSQESANGLLEEHLLRSENTEAIHYPTVAQSSQTPQETLDFTISSEKQLNFNSRRDQLMLGLLEANTKSDTPASSSTQPIICTWKDESTVNLEVNSAPESQKHHTALSDVQERHAAKPSEYGTDLKVMENLFFDSEGAQSIPKWEEDQSFLSSLKMHLVSHTQQLQSASSSRRSPLFPYSLSDCSIADEVKPSLSNIPVEENQDDIAMGKQEKNSDVMQISSTAVSDYGIPVVKKESFEFSPDFASGSGSFMSTLDEFTAKDELKKYLLEMEKLVPPSSHGESVAWTSQDGSAPVSELDSKTGSQLDVSEEPKVHEKKKEDLEENKWEIFEDYVDGTVKRFKRGWLRLSEVGEKMFSFSNNLKEFSIPEAVTHEGLALELPPGILERLKRATPAKFNRFNYKYMRIAGDSIDLEDKIIKALCSQLPSPTNTKASSCRNFDSFYPDQPGPSWKYDDRFQAKSLGIWNPEKLLETMDVDEELKAETLQIFSNLFPEGAVISFETIKLLSRVFCDFLKNEYLRRSDYKAFYSKQLPEAKTKGYWTDEPPISFDFPPTGLNGIVFLSNSDQGKLQYATEPSTSTEMMCPPEFRKRFDLESNKTLITYVSTSIILKYYKRLCIHQRSPLGLTHINIMQSLMHAEMIETKGQPASWMLWACANVEFYEAPIRTPFLENLYNEFKRIWKEKRVEREEEVQKALFTAENLRKEAIEKALKEKIEKEEEEKVKRRMAVPVSSPRPTCYRDLASDQHVPPMSDHFLAEGMDQESDDDNGSDVKITFGTPETRASSKSIRSVATTAGSTPFGTPKEKRGSIIVSQTKRGSLTNSGTPDEGGSGSRKRSRPIPIGSSFYKDIATEYTGQTPKESQGEEGVPFGEDGGTFLWLFGSPRYRSKRVVESDDDADDGPDRHLRTPSGRSPRTVAEEKAARKRWKDEQMKLREEGRLPIPKNNSDNEEEKNISSRTDPVSPFSESDSEKIDIASSGEQKSEIEKEPEPTMEVFQTELDTSGTCKQFPIKTDMEGSEGSFENLSKLFDPLATVDTIELDKTLRENDIEEYPNNETPTKDETLSALKGNILGDVVPNEFMPKRNILSMPQRFTGKISPLAQSDKVMVTGLITKPVRNVQETIPEGLRGTAHVVSVEEKANEREFVEQIELPADTESSADENADSVDMQKPAISERQSRPRTRTRHPTTSSRLTKHFAIDEARLISEKDSLESLEFSSSLATTSSLSDTPISERPPPKVPDHTITYINSGGERKPIIKFLSRSYVPVTPEKKPEPIIPEIREPLPRILCPRETPVISSPDQDIVPENEKSSPGPQNWDKNALPNFQRKTKLFIDDEQSEEEKAENTRNFLEAQRKLEALKESLGLTQRARPPEPEYIPMNLRPEYHNKTPREIAAEVLKKYADPNRSVARKLFKIQEKPETGEESEKIEECKVCDIFIEGEFPRIPETPKVDEQLKNLAPPPIMKKKKTKTVLKRKCPIDQSNYETYRSPQQNLGYNFYRLYERVCKELEKYETIQKMGAEIEPSCHNPAPRGELIENIVILREEEVYYDQSFYYEEITDDEEEEKPSETIVEDLEDKQLDLLPPTTSFQNDTQLTKSLAVEVSDDSAALEDLISISFERPKKGENVIFEKFHEVVEKRPTGRIEVQQINQTDSQAIATVDPQLIPSVEDDYDSFEEHSDTETDGETDSSDYGLCKPSQLMQPYEDLATFVFETLDRCPDHSVLEVAEVKKITAVQAAVTKTKGTQGVVCQLEEQSTLDENTTSEEKVTTSPAKKMKGKKSRRRLPKHKLANLIEMNKWTGCSSEEEEEERWENKWKESQGRKEIERMKEKKKNLFEEEPFKKAVFSFTPSISLLRKQSEKKDVTVEFLNRSKSMKRRTKRRYQPEFLYELPENEGYEDTIIEKDDFDMQLKGFPGLLQLAQHEDLEVHQMETISFDTICMQFIKLYTSFYRERMLKGFHLAHEDYTRTFPKCRSDMDYYERMFISFMQGKINMFLLTAEENMSHIVNLHNADEDHITFAVNIVYLCQDFCDYVECRNDPEVDKQKLLEMQVEFNEKVDHVTSECEEFLEEYPLMLPIILLMKTEVMGVGSGNDLAELVCDLKGIPLKYRLLYVVRCCINDKLEPLLLQLFDQVNGVDRLMFVGIGRHFDTFAVLSEYLVETGDFQKVAHLLLAGRVFEDSLHYFHILHQILSYQDLNFEEPIFIEPEFRTEEMPEELFESSELPDRFTLADFLDYNVNDEAHPINKLVRLWNRDIPGGACRVFCYLYRNGRLPPLYHLDEIYEERYIPGKMTFEAYHDICHATVQRYLEFLNTVDLNGQNIFMEEITNKGFSDERHEVPAFLRHSMAMIAGNKSFLPDQSENKEAEAAAAEAKCRKKEENSKEKEDIADKINTDFELDDNPQDEEPEEEEDENGGMECLEAEVKGYPEQACPYCRKPMVRCTVCTVMDRTEWAISPFMEMDDEWTVCYSCHHGGHSLHIMDWFQKHDKCAVPKCRCRCNRHPDFRTMNARYKETIQVNNSSWNF